MILQQPAARHQTEKLIYQRRNQDQANDRLQTKLKQEFYEKEFAKFENKGNVLGKQKYVQQRLAQMRAQSRAELNQRKAKLARMLNQEHESFKQEIKDLQETPEQVRQKMQDRVQHLKEEKEKIRREFVDKQLERRFLQNADELRKVDQEYNELKALQERNIQMMEKQKLLEDKYREEMVYAALYKRDIQKKEKEEQRKLQAAMEKLQERNRILSMQLELNRQKRNDLENENNNEKSMLNHEWKMEDLRHQKQMQDQREFLQKLNNEIQSTNIQQQERKHTLKQEEKTQDKIWVNGIVEKEKMLDFLENEQKRRTQQETRDFMKSQVARSNDAEIFEKQAEKLIAEENEKQYQRQKAKWDKEEQARIQLMYDVYADREKNIVEKQNYAEVVKQEKQVEKDILNKAVKEYEEEQERKRLEEFQNNKRHQEKILGQAAEKEQRRQQTLHQLWQEDQDELERQRQYEARIQAQKDKGKLLLEELRRQRPF